MERVRKISSFTKIDADAIYQSFSSEAKSVVDNIGFQDLIELSRSNPSMISDNSNIINEVCKMFSEFIYPDAHIDTMKLLYELADYNFFYNQKEYEHRSDWIDSVDEFMETAIDRSSCNKIERDIISNLLTGAKTNSIPEHLRLSVQLGAVYKLKKAVGDEAKKLIHLMEKFSSFNDWLAKISECLFESGEKSLLRFSWDLIIHVYKYDFLIALSIDKTDQLIDLVCQVAFGKNTPVSNSLIKDWNISDLDISIRTKRCLKQADIVTIGSLIAQNRRDVSKLPGIGKTTMSELDYLLETLHLSFNDA